MEEPFEKIGKYYYDDPVEKKNGKFDIVTQDDRGYIFLRSKISERSSDRKHGSKRDPTGNTNRFKLLQIRIFFQIRLSVRSRRKSDLNRTKGALYVTLQVSLLHRW